MDREIKYPRGERVWVAHYSKSQLEYIITTKENNKEMYYLYTYDGEHFSKFAKSKSPIELEAKYRKEVQGD